MHPPDPLHAGAAPTAGPLPAAHWTVLILRDVLHWPADDTAALLGVLVPEAGS